MELINEGYSSCAYRDGDYIILVGKNENSYANYEKLYHMYKFLNGRINSVEVPFSVKKFEPSKEYPYGALRTEWIYGSVLDYQHLDKFNKANFIDKIVSFFMELYVIDITAYDYDFDIVEYRKNKMLTVDANIEILKDYLNEEELLKLVNWRKKYKKYLNSFDDYHFIHGDMWYENFIFSNDYQNLIGIIDWENARIDDPAVDLAALSCISSDIVDKIIDRLAFLSEDIKDRVKLHAELKDLLSLEYILRYESKNDFRALVKKIKESTIFE